MTAPSPTDRSLRLTICGAGREVTGSCYLVEAGGTRFLVDCGLHQGGDKEEARNREPFPFDPRELDFVLLTHAHIDHSGRLPLLTRKGFAGPIFTTAATADLAEIMLLDSAHIQEMEAEWRTRKARRAGRVEQGPLYTQDDAREVARRFRHTPYGEELRPGAGVSVRFLDAGHILGSAIVPVRLESGGQAVSLVFSGDVGRSDQPILRDPEPVERADCLLMEATYGDRLHEGNADPKEELRACLEQARRSGGNIVIPSFAVGRTQELVYLLRELYEERGFTMPVFVDSPLAVAATAVYRRHREGVDAEAEAVLAGGGSLFDFPKLRYTESADESKALNGREGVVIISSSGMADAGRIKHHLKHNLWRPEAQVVFVGYQAAGTLGRRLLEGARKVTLFGEEIAVRAQIREVSGFSAHADREELLAWASRFSPPGLTLLVHGEPQAAFALAKLLEERLHFRVRVPERGAVVPLDDLVPDGQPMTGEEHV